MRECGVTIHRLRVDQNLPEPQMIVLSDWSCLSARDFSSSLRVDRRTINVLLL